MLKTCLMRAYVLTLLSCLYPWIWCHALISLNMANEEDVLVDLSENVIEDKVYTKVERK